MTTATMTRTRSGGSVREFVAIVAVAIAALLVAVVLAGSFRSVPLVVDPAPAIGPSPAPAVVTRAAAAAGASGPMTPAQPDPPLR